MTLGRKPIESHRSARLATGRIARSGLAALRRQSRGRASRVCEDRSIFVVGINGRDPETEG